VPFCDHFLALLAEKFFIIDVIKSGNFHLLCLPTGGEELVDIVTLVCRMPYATREAVQKS